MTGRARRSAALVVAAGFLLAAVAPASAEPSDNEAIVSEHAPKPGKPIELIKPATGKTLAKISAKPPARAKLASRLRKPGRVAAQARRPKTVQAKAGASAGDPAARKAIPTKVADARAQIPSPPDSDRTAAPLEIAAADQMNELDRALNEPPAKLDNADRAVMQMAAAAPAPPIVAAPVTPPVSYAQTSNGRPSNESSLVGKIFIAFGGLLTLASAARMLIA